jgi:hypothetical protein
VLMRSRTSALSVMPAQAGIHGRALDCGLRRK